MHAEHPVSNDRNTASDERDELAEDDDSQENEVVIEKQKHKRSRNPVNSQFLPLSPASPASRPLALAPTRRPMDIHNVLGPAASTDSAERWGVQTSAERSTSLET